MAVAAAVVLRVSRGKLSTATAKSNGFGAVGGARRGAEEAAAAEADEDELLLLLPPPPPLLRLAAAADEEEEGLLLAAATAGLAGAAAAVAAAAVAAAVGDADGTGDGTGPPPLRGNAAAWIGSGCSSGRGPAITMVCGEMSAALLLGAAAEGNGSIFLSLWRQRKGKGEGGE